MSVRWLLAIFVVSLVIGTSAQEQEPKAVWHNCIFNGSNGNFAGYMSQSEDYKCDEGILRIQGKWGEAVQNGWLYHYKFERSCAGANWVGTDWEPPAFQLWRRNKYGWELYGWNEAEQTKEDQRRKTTPAPPYKSSVVTRP